MFYRLGSCWRENGVQNTNFLFVDHELTGKKFQFINRINGKWIPCIWTSSKTKFEIPKINDTDQECECEAIQPHKIARWSIKQKMNEKKKKMKRMKWNEIKFTSRFGSLAVQGEFVLNLVDFLVNNNLNLSKSSDYVMKQRTNNRHWLYDCDLKKIAKYFVNELNPMVFGVRENEVFYLNSDIEKVPAFFKKMNVGRTKRKWVKKLLCWTGSLCLLIISRSIWSHEMRQIREYISGCWKWMSKKIEKTKRFFLEIAIENVLNGSKWVFIYELFALVCFM